MVPNINVLTIIASGALFMAVSPASAFSGPTLPSHDVATQTLHLAEWQAGKPAKTDENWDKGGGYGGKPESNKQNQQPKKEWDNGKSSNSHKNSDWDEDKHSSSNKKPDYDEDRHSSKKDYDEEKHQANKKYDDDDNHGSKLKKWYKDNFQAKKYDDDDDHHASKKNYDEEKHQSNKKYDDDEDTHASKKNYDEEKHQSNKKYDDDEDKHASKKNWDEEKHQSNKKWEEDEDHGSKKDWGGYGGKQTKPAKDDASDKNDTGKTQTNNTPPPVVDSSACLSQCKTKCTADFVPGSSKWNSCAAGCKSGC